MRCGFCLRDGGRQSALLVRGIAILARRAQSWPGLLLPDLSGEASRDAAGQAGLNRCGNIRMASRLLHENTASAAARQGSQQ